jgi:hypothetical protein
MGAVHGMSVLLGTIDGEQLLSYSWKPHAVFLAPNLYKVELSATENEVCLSDIVPLSG